MIEGWHTPMICNWQVGLILFRVNLNRINLLRRNKEEYRVKYQIVLYQSNEGTANDTHTQYQTITALDKNIVFASHLDPHFTENYFTKILVIIFFSAYFSIRYHGSWSSIKCHVYHHVGGKRHTRVCNENKEPHTSHYPSNQKKQPTNYSYQPLSQSTGRIFFKNCNISFFKKIGFM